MRSRPENSSPNTVNRVPVRPAIQVRIRSNPMRMNMAMNSPVLRATSRRFWGSLSTSIEMKMTLSMPSTSSSAVRVANAIQACGSVRMSIIGISSRCGLARTRQPPRRSAAAQQDQHRAATARMARGFAVREHVVPVREPLAHLALEHRLAIRGGEALAVHDPHAAITALARLVQEVGEHVARFVGGVAVQVELRLQRPMPAPQLAEHVGA